jgi:hypothetical protein
LKFSRELSTPKQANKRREHRGVSASAAILGAPFQSLGTQKQSQKSQAKAFDRRGHKNDDQLTIG